MLSYFDNGVVFGSHSRARNISFHDQFDGDRVAFFDGAELHGSCGAGMVIQMATNHSFHICMNAGKGTNT